MRGGVQGHCRKGRGVSLPKRSRESNEGKVIAHWGPAVASRRRWHLVLALTMGDLDMLRWRKVFSGFRTYTRARESFCLSGRGDIQEGRVGLNCHWGGICLLGWGAESFRGNLTDSVSCGWVSAESLHCWFCKEQKNTKDKANRRVS